MKHVNRRLFLRTGITGILATTMLPPSFSQTLNKPTLPSLIDDKSDESWWMLVKKLFPLEDGLHYFNNGSLGPSPEIVIDSTEKYRRMLDGFPSEYMWGGWRKDVEEVRTSMAEFLKAESEEIALIHNTTEGMNLFAQSFDLKNGDEIILGDHEHRTGTVPYEYFGIPRGIKIVRPVLPVLPESEEELFEVYRKHITTKTKLISMVHMTNTNGMILPVKMIAEYAHKKNIIVCVDGAQTAGMIRIDLHDLQCDFFAASGHKWLFGPKGTGILYAKKDRIKDLQPLLVSNHFKEPNIRMFEDYNTRNLPEVLGLGTAIEFNNLLGAERKEKRIYQLKHHFRSQIENDKRFSMKTPANDRLSAGIQVVELVGKDVNKVRNYLREHYNLDVRPMNSHALNALRISLSVFNSMEDVNFLVKVLKKIADTNI